MKETWSCKHDFEFILVKAAKPPQSQSVRCMKIFPSVDYHQEREIIIRSTFGPIRWVNHKDSHLTIKICQVVKLHNPIWYMRNIIGVWIQRSLWYTISWNVGSGYDWFDIKEGIVCIFCWGFLEKKIFAFSYDFIWKIFNPSKLKLKRVFMLVVPLIWKSRDMGCSLDACWWELDSAQNWVKGHRIGLFLSRTNSSILKWTWIEE